MLHRLKGDGRPCPSGGEGVSPVQGEANWAL